ncbi:hypothetical protein [Viridibacterium curvum]|uniref:Uncharacterized protein n=1 Tax=Viridibacterium curvum TaxID=1101404 RepID=A0ABP9QPN8_9RHOO
MVRCLVALLTALLTLPAAAQRSTGVLAAHAACDGSLFRALAADAPRWRSEKSFRHKGKLASFAVDSRQPPEGIGSPAMLDFRRTHRFDALPVTGWFDADLSHWSRFARFEVGFLSWGFYIDASPADVRDTLIRHAPTIGRRITASSAQKPDVFCIQERWETPDGQPATDRVEGARWQPVSCSADEDFPTEQVPIRWLVIRPFGDSGRSVLSCELAGKWTPEMLATLRPDIPALDLK